MRRSVVQPRGICVLVAVGSLLLASCGGQRADLETPPNIVSRHPAVGDTSGFPPFTVTFDRPLDPSSVNSDSVRVLRKYSIVRSSVELSGDGKTVRVSPLEPLAPPTRLEVELSPAIRDLAGNSFARESSPWVFDVPVWAAVGGPSPISPGTADYPSVSLVLDAQGRPAVGTARNPPIVGFAVRFEDGRWTPLPNPASGEIDRTLSLVSGPNGEIWLVHAAPGFSGDSIEVLRLVDGDWEPVAPNLPLPERRVYGLGIAATPTGKPFAAWTSDPRDASCGGCGRSVAGASAYFAGSWQSWPHGAQADRTAITASPAGGAYAAWRTFTTSTGSDGYTHFSYGPGLVARLTDRIEHLPPVGDYVHDVAIAADRSGSTFVAFAGSDVRVAHLDGNAWVNVGGAIGGPNYLEAGSPVLALTIDPSGAPVVAWIESTPNTVGQLFVARWDGSAWARLGGPLNVDPSRHAAGVALALDADGLPFIAWAEQVATEKDSSGYENRLCQFFVKKMNR